MKKKVFFVCLYIYIYLCCKCVDDIKQFLIADYIDIFFSNANTD